MHERGTATLAPDLHDLERRLTRQGYPSKILAERFHAIPTEVRRFVNDQLGGGRTCDFTDRTGEVGSAF